MKHGEEALYLSRRTGFIKMAMQHHAAVVPAFAFGQTEMYSWIKPGALQSFYPPSGKRLHTMTRQATGRAATLLLLLPLLLAVATDGFDLHLAPLVGYDL